MNTVVVIVKRKQNTWALKEEWFVELRQQTERLYNVIKFQLYHDRTKRDMIWKEKEDELHLPGVSLAN